MSDPDAKPPPSIEDAVAQLQANLGPTAEVRLHGDEIWIWTSQSARKFGGVQLPAGTKIRFLGPRSPTPDP